MKFEFGEKVRVKATLIRMHGSNNRRYWQVFDGHVDFEAIFLGYRTLRDGKSEWTNYGDEGADWYFEYDKIHKGALVCRKGFNPIKVFLEHIEKIP